MIPLLHYCTSNRGSCAGFAASWQENSKNGYIIIILLLLFRYLFFYAIIQHLLVEIREKVLYTT